MLSRSTPSPCGADSTINGVDLSAVPGGLAVASTHTIALAAATENPQLQALITLAEQTYTAVESSRAPSDVVPDIITLSRGGADATIHGVKFSAGSVGLVIDGAETISFSHRAPTSFRYAR